MYFFYYYPLGVDVPRDRFPVVTILLMLCMTGVFLASVPLLRFNEVSWGAYVYRPATASMLTPLTALFLHGGWFHLLGNLLYLWVFGPALERALRRVGFLVVFLGCGYLGNLCQAALTLRVAPEAAMAGVIGASGAISGLMGLFMLRFFFARVQLAYWVFMPLQGVNRAGVAHLPVLVGIFLWVGLQITLAIVARGGGGVAYGAHLGGLGAGLMLGCSLGMLTRGRREHLRVRARRDQEAGNYYRAVGLLERYVEQLPWDEDAQLDLTRALCLKHDWGKAQRRYTDMVRALVGRNDIEGACELYQEARRGNGAFVLPPREQRRLAFWLEKTGRFAASATAHLDYARVYKGADESGHSLARAATLLIGRVGRRDEGLEALDRAIEEHPDLHWRDLLLQERQRLMRAGPV